MNKRGQLFILSAVIISVILITLTTVFNYATSEKEPKGLYDFSDNIKKEGFEVITYGIYNSKDSKQILTNYTNNISDYILGAEPDAQFFFIYGNKTSIRIEDYSKNYIPSNINIQVGESSFIRDIVTSTSKDYRTLYYKELTPDSSNSIDLTINNKVYTIPINPGQNFIVLMKKTYKNNSYLYLE